MNDNFVPYEIAKAVQQKGFNEVCFLYWRAELDGSMQLFHYNDKYIEDAHGSQNSDNAKYVDCTAPLWQQVVEWILDKYGLFVWVNGAFIGRGDYEGMISIKEEKGLMYIRQTQTTKLYSTYREALQAAIEKALTFI